MLLSSSIHGRFARTVPMNYSTQDLFDIVCSALGLYNAFELLALIFMTFKRRKGLYFWSILLASFGVISYSVGWMIRYLNLPHEYIALTINSIGWILMISGQSVVLYSRLHLVLSNVKILRAVLWMIICNGIVWHTSITVLLFGSVYSPPKSKRGFNAVYNVLEKVQMTCFCLQEFIISGLYIWKTSDILKTALGNTRRIMWQLFGINIVISIMDIALLSIEYTNHFFMEQGVKVVIYSLKLKLEFAVLNQLIAFVHRHRGTNSGSHSNSNTAVFMELSGNRSRTADKKARSLNKLEVTLIEGVETSAAVTTTLKISSRKESEDDQIKVATSLDIESCALDPGDYAEVSTGEDVRN